MTSGKIYQNKQNENEAKEEVINKDSASEII